MLIDTNIFILYRFILDYISQSVIIKSYQNIKIFTRFVIKSYSQIKRIIKIKSVMILISNLIINISINYHDTLSNDRDYLFKPELSIYLDKKDGVFTHVVDLLMIFVQIKNVIETSIMLLRNTRLNIMIKYIADEYYQVFYKLSILIVYN